MELETSSSSDCDSKAFGSIKDSVLLHCASKCNISSKKKDECGVDLSIIQKCI